VTCKIGILGPESLLQSCDGGARLQPDIRRVRKRFRDSVDYGGTA
jgi:hypothetical protein